jgi:hypothetical protein
MNHLQIGLTAEQFEYPKGSLVIMDEPILNGARSYLTPLKTASIRSLQYREARELAAALDKDLMTYRNGRRALTRLMRNADGLDRLVYTRNDDDQETKG